MKKILFAILAFLLVLLMACSPGSSDEDLWKEYREWREINNTWLAEQQARVDASGDKYYETLVAPWNPKGYVLIHYFNDRAATEGNLSPLFTSSVDVKYHGTLYNATPFDSSYTMTAYGPGIARFSLNSVIEGWSLALCEMRCGDTAEVLIPYSMAYGTAGSGSIPPYSNLKFNIKLVDIVDYETRPSE